nr:Na+/H+ antiporter subunit G [uncultured Ottowia sp.]
MSAAALPVPLWAEILVSLLLLASAVFTLAAAIGLVRLQSFFQRMHPPALIYTGAAWCVTLASITYFSAQGHGLVLHVWIIIILLSITAPIATVLLARAALFRNRQERLAGTPLPLQPMVEPSLAEGESADPQT